MRGDREREKRADTHGRVSEDEGCAKSGKATPRYDTNNKNHKHSDR